MARAQEKTESGFAAQTGVGPTFLVAIEQQFPTDQRIIHDGLAKQILPFGYKVFLGLTQISWIRDWMVRATDKQAHGIWSGVMCRKRYIDDKVAEAVAGSVETVVNLGTGHDTRAYRLQSLANVPVWEIDQPVNIEAKRSSLQKVFGEIPSHVTLVPIDFNRQELGTVLASHGYAADTKTFFIWEAVTQYLTEAGLHQTFDFLAQAPAGSLLAFTYVRKDFIEGKARYEQETVYKRFVVREKAWHFGFDPEEVADFLSEYGWRVLEHHGYDDLAERYLKPTGRKLPSMAIERMVYAEKL